MGLPRLRTLTPADLAALPVCPDCGFAADPDEPWARGAQQQWAMVGVECGAWVGASAFALVALPELLPEDHPLSRQEQSDQPLCHNTAILLAVHVEGDQRWRQRTLSRLVVTALAGKLSGRVQAIEAAASRVHSTCQAPSSAWLADLGFRPTPSMEWLPGGARRMRLDLDSTVTWQVPWATLLRRLLRPRDRPEPEAAGRISSESASRSAGSRPAG